ncbi:hypothetical protein RI054_11g58070 [Pseudoscourfieldia marina]
MPECKVSCASVALENAGSPTLKVPENVLSPGRYVFTMTVTDVNNGGLTATAKMAVVINSPPTQGIVLVEPLSGTELVERFAVFSTGFEDADVPLSYMYGVVTADGDAFPLTSAQATQYAELDLPSSAVAVIAMAFDTYGASTIRQAPVTVITLSQSGIGGVAEMLNQKLTELEGIIAEGNDASAALELAEAIGAAMNNVPVLPTDVDALTTRKAQREFLSTLVISIADMPDIVATIDKNGLGRVLHALGTATKAPSDYV